MRIALDLDGTVIRSDIDFPLEEFPKGFNSLLAPREKLRSGTIQLYLEVIKGGDELWVYTSSYRDRPYIKRLFRKYGIKLSGIINQPAHDKAIARFEGDQKWISKYPPVFGIDLLIEDSEGVEIEGKRWEFEVLLIRGDDENWVDKVLERIDLLKGKQSR